MKRITLYLITAFIIVLAFCNCKGKTYSQVSNARLLERMIPDYGQEMTFTHDSQNRIAKISYRENNDRDYEVFIMYVSDNKVIEKYIYANKNPDREIVFTINNNVITYETGRSWVITLNSDGYIEKVEDRDKNNNATQISNYEYQNGLLVSIKLWDNSEGALYQQAYRNFTFDDKKSPFYEDNTPGWLLQRLLDVNGMKNNLTFEDNNIYSYNMEYEYDEDGFATLAARFWTDGGEEDYNITKYIYRGRSRKIFIDDDIDPIKMGGRVAELNSQLNQGTGDALAIIEEYLKIHETAETLSEINRKKFETEKWSWFRGYEDEIYSPEDFKYVQTVEFSDQSIPITVFRKPVKSEFFNGISVYKLEFVYDGSQKVINATGDFNEEMILTDIITNDYNFDNYMDVGILYTPGSSNSFYLTFLYDPNTKKYVYNKELSDLSYVYPDKETQTVRYHMKGGHAGAIYNAGEYEWRNGKLTHIVSIDQDYDDESEKYIRTTKTLQNDGKWDEKTESFTYEELYETE